LLAVPIVAVFIMTQWDLVMDAPESTLSKAWIWHEGGSYFGVPLSNFLGWLLTSWLFFQAFALYLHVRFDVQAPWRPQSHRRALQFAAVLLYAAAGLTHVTAWAMGQTGEIADAAGHVWRVSDLRATTVIVMLFTMMPTAVIATLRLLRTD